MRLPCTLLFVMTGVASAQPSDAPPPEPVDVPKPVVVEPPVQAEPPAPPPVVTPPAPIVESPAAPKADADVLPKDTGFRFGSYGRIIAGDDLRGGKPEQILVVANGPRVVEDSYLELEFAYGFETKTGVRLRPVVTIAFDGTLFHDTGEFDAHPAIRNMFLDAAIDDHLTAWVGSRMYRGDDIYLFDYWPLDNQNTIGGGLQYRQRITERPGTSGDTLELAAHAGANRLNQPFQFQQIEVANPEQGAATVVQLNRQRLVVSADASYLMDHGPRNLSIKLKVHGELQGITSGTSKRDDGTFEQLPSDSGYLIGAELSLFGLAPRESGFRRHLNLFTRYAQGLAAFDELEVPTSFGPDLKTTNANELSFGASGNWDAPFGNMMIGALSRRFIDATGNDVSYANGWEYALDARPLLRVHHDLYAGADISYQARFPRGLSPFTERAEDPAVFQIAPMLVYSPMGPSAYDRPQIRVVYRGAHLNDGARDLYVPDDPRHDHTWVHFLGVEAEWWFNSSTYH